MLGVRKGARVIPRWRAAAFAVVGAVGALTFGALSVYATTPPPAPPEPTTTAPTTTTAVPPATEPPATEPPETEPPATDPPATEPPATEPPSTETSEPPASAEPVDTTEPTVTSEPAVPSIVATTRLFPDSNGNFLDDEGDEATVAEEEAPTIAAVVDATNSSLDAADVVIVMPGGGSRGFGGVDVTVLRVAGASSASVRVAYSDNTTRELPVGGSPIDVTLPELRVESLVVTFTGVAPGAAVRFDVQGTLNESAVDPAIELCTDVTATNPGGQSAVNDCDGMAVIQPEPEVEDPGIGVLSLVVQPEWTLDPATGTGTMTLPAPGFPAATLTTDSDGPVLAVGTDAFLNTDTPFGTAFASTADQQFLSTTAGAALDDPSTTTFQFSAPTPAGWGFALGDIDLDIVTITALGPGGVPLTPEQLGFQGTFNYCVGDPLPPACGGVQDPFTVPFWDPSTGTIAGGDLNAGGSNTNGASAWFRPTVPITSLTFTQRTDQGTAPLMQLWFAARTSDISGTITAETSGGFPQIVPAGTVLQLLNADGSPAVDSAGNPFTTTPNADGTYLFDEVPSAPYQVALLTPAGWTIVGASELAADASTDDVAGVDFLMRQNPPPTTTTTTTTTTTAPAGTVDISGTVAARTADGVPLLGVPDGVGLRLLDGNFAPVLDADGNPLVASAGFNGSYRFDNVPAGTYFVVISVPEGWEPLSISEFVNASAGDVGGVDFVIQQLSEAPPPSDDGGGLIIIEPPPDCTPPPDEEPLPNPEDAPLPPPPPPPPGCPPIVRALPPPTPNPPLQAACGITVNLVVDRSYSIQTAGATNAVKSALTAFINTLNNTGSSVAVVDFAEQAVVAVPFTPLSDSTRGQFDTYIRNYNPNGTNTKGTNWDDALYRANAIGGPADADLTLFLTDGEPNKSGPGHHPSSTNSNTVLEYAAIHANEIKGSGTRMFVVGVGDVAGNTSKLAAVSGPTNGTDIATADYSTVPDFDDLAASLEDLVFGLCSSSMTVSKLVDGVLTPGWDITATVTAVTPAGTRFQWRNPALVGTPPASRITTTGPAGTATFEWVLGSEAQPVPGSVSMRLNEAVKPGFSFVDGNCSIDSASGADRTVSFTALPADIGSIPFDAIVRCSLNNTKVPIVVPVAPTIEQAECIDGALSPPTLTLPPNSDSISYAAAPAAPYAPGQTVVVTATLAAGNVWPTPMPSGWTRTSNTTATYTVTFADVSCAPATPLGPSVVQATCVNGEVTEPTITAENTPGITYTVSPAGTYDGTQSYTVTVTATLDDGYAWVDPLPSGWTRVDDVTATSTVQLTAASCTEVTPAAPQINEAQCVAGEVTDPTLTLPTTDGIIYEADPPAPYAPGDTVVITATLISTGFAWPATLPDGWTETSPTTAEYTVTFADVSCTPATPIAPEVVQAACVNGGLTVPSITPRPAAGMTYTFSPTSPYPPGEDHTVVVTATLDDGFTWVDPLPDGWTYVDPTTATFTVELVAATCRPVSPALPMITEAECVDGAMTEPRIVPVPMPGVSYSVDPPTPYEPGRTVVVTATLNPTGVAWSDPLPDGWTRVDSVTATYTVTFADVSCTPATPLDPNVVQATCADGAVTVPTITPTPADGITYTLSPAGPYDGTVGTTVTVTATLADSYAWVDPLPAGWTRVSATTATFTVTLAAATCTPTTPTAPGIDQAECVDGAVTEPTLTLPTTDGITYTTDVAPPYTPGDTVVVTAMLDATGVAWPPQAEMPAGWTITSATTATYTVEFADVSCAPATPLDPAVVQATCADGGVTVPTVTPTPVEGITYAVDPAGPYDGTVDTTVTVTATLADGYAWSDPLPEGWTEVDLVTATFTVELAAAACDEVEPVAPGVVEAECVDGALTEPTLTLPDTPGITYTTDADAPYAPGQTVIVTATLDPTGVGWPEPLPDGWKRTSATTATYTVTFADESCTPATPLDPAVVQATCTEGEVTEPTITPQPTDGVSYVLDPEPAFDGTEDTTVTVTAMLADGYEWDLPLPGDWVYVDPVTATLTVELVGTTCDEVIPVAPAIAEAECVYGALTAPTLTTPDTDGITYSTDEDPPYAAGQTVVVTATLDDTGVAWPDELPAGWTETSPTTATFTVTFDDVSCTPVGPVAPAVVQATCANGAVTAPSVTPVESSGITYVFTPPEPYDGTVDTSVLVTTTLEDGFEWVDPLPAGWTRVDAVTATFAVELAAASCQTVTPAVPVVDQAECVDGALTEPTLTVGPTTGVTYTTNAPPPYAPGETVVVTATLDATGVAWPATLPDGWTRVDAMTATYTVTFADISCTPATPLDPNVAQATCADGAVTVPTITPTPADGITYTLSPDGPYDGTVTTAVTVTATLADGYAWVDPLPAGWTSINATTATFTVELAATTCAEMTPAAPTLQQAQCVGGVVTEPALTLAATDGITYAIDVAAPYAPGQTVVVTATLDDAGVAWPAELPLGWTETSATTATFTVTLAATSCQPATPFNPEDPPLFRQPPGIVPATCRSGLVRAPMVNVQATPGVSYALDPPAPYDGTVDTRVTITATLADGYAWADALGEGWTLVDAVTATYVVELAATSCVEVVPATLAITEAECVGGGLTEPALTLGTTEGMTLDADIDRPYAPGQTVVVTATLDPSGVGWPDTLPDGWTRTSATVATFEVTFAGVSCTPATPLDPAVVQATCTEGEVTEPTITPTPADGITYAVDPAGPYDGTEDTTVTVTATLADGYEWSQPAPDGWTYVDPVTATFTVELIGTTCDEVTPVAPAIDEATCVDGALTQPTLTTPDTDGIAYTTDPQPPFTPGQTVVVTATLDPEGVGWPDELPPGWTETSSTTATYTVTLADVSCTPATPLAPVVAQATCANGAVSAPTVDVPPVEGITYGIDPARPYDGTVDTTVTLTATIADGFAWADPLPDGWTQVDLVTATYTVELAAASCTEVIPVVPENHGPECVDGELVPATLEFPETDGITYSVNAAPPYAPGQTVVVTATIDAEGVSWPAELPAEWVATSATTATYTHTFADVSCTTVLPVSPGIVVASCSADGSVVPSSVTLASTPGIVYTASPPGPYDPAVDTEVVVTATLEDGYAWGDVGAGGPLGFAGRSVEVLPGGWEQTGPTTATFTVTLPALPECPAPAPVAPDAGTTTTVPSGGPLPGTE